MTSELLIEPSVSRASSSEFTPLQKAILLTVHYRDLFSHALTIGELKKYLLLLPLSTDSLEPALARLQASHLSRVGDYVTWKGREWLVAERRKRWAASEQLWPKALRYGRLVQRIPFLRMAGVSGSLAVDHAREDRDDIDLFCIAEPHRVWIVMFFLKALQACSLRLGMPFLCANTCLAQDRLNIASQNLYMAHQIAHVVPMWGEDVYNQFLQKNQWVKRFLPNAFGEQRSRPIRGCRSRLIECGERLLPNWIGDHLNTGICRAAVRKAGRFYRATHTDDALHEARNPTRYMLPGLGYTGNIFRRFIDGHPSRFANILSTEEMEAAFGCDQNVFFDLRLDTLFRSKYEHRG